MVQLVVGVAVLAFHSPSLLESSSGRKNVYSSGCVQGSGLDLYYYGGLLRPGPEISLQPHAQLFLFLFSACCSVAHAICNILTNTESTNSANHHISIQGVDSKKRPSNRKLFRVDIHLQTESCPPPQAFQQGGPHEPSAKQMLQTSIFDDARKGPATENCSESTYTFKPKAVLPLKRFSKAALTNLQPSRCCKHLFLMIHLLD